MTSVYTEPDHVKKSADFPGLPPPQQPVDPTYGGPPPSYSNQPGPSAYPPYGQPQMQSAYPQPYQQQGAWNEPPPPSMYPPPPGPPMGYGYGAPPPQQQQQQQVVVIGAPGPTAAVPIVHIETFVGQIVLSCFVFWCCNWLFGLVAFILAMVAGSNAVNDPKGARSLGKASYGVSIAGIIITVVIIIIVVAVVVTRTTQVVDAAVNAANSASSSSTCSSYYYYYGSVCYRSYSSSLSKTQCLAMNGYYSSIYGCYYSVV